MSVNDLLDRIAPIFQTEKAIREKENHGFNLHQAEEFAVCDRKNAKPKHRAGDWVCVLCNNHNYSFREVCNRCKQQTKQANIMQSLAAYHPPQASTSSLYQPVAAYPQSQTHTSSFFASSFPLFLEGKQPFNCTATLLKQKDASQPDDDTDSIFGFSWLNTTAEEPANDGDTLYVEESIDEINRNRKILKLFSADN